MNPASIGPGVKKTSVFDGVVNASRELEVIYRNLQNQQTSMTEKHNMQKHVVNGWLDNFVSTEHISSHRNSFGIEIAVASSWQLD